MTINKLYRWFRNIAFAEGVSFVALVFIAMPLKYLAKIPIAVTIAGSLHGLLFISFIKLAWDLKVEGDKSAIWFGKAFLASVLPFGTFYMDHKSWKAEEQQLRGNRLEVKG